VELGVGVWSMCLEYVFGVGVCDGLGVWSRCLELVLVIPRCSEEVFGVSVGVGVLVMAKVFGIGVRSRCLE
jgi:hypothetical protein